MSKNQKVAAAGQQNAGDNSNNPYFQEDIDVDDEDKSGQTWMPKNDYRARSRCGKSFQRGPMTKDEVMEELFDLLPRDNEELDLQHYYIVKQRDEFIDLLHQLALVSPKKDIFRIRIKEDFEGTEERHFLFTHKEIWTKLDEFMVGRENHEIEGKWEETEYFSLQNIGDLLHYRQVTYDIFHLLDQDNDQILRKKSIKPSLKCEQGDINQPFFEKVAEQLEDPNDQQAKEWIEQLKKEFDKDVNYHEFQKLLWTGSQKFKLNIEELQFQIYRSKTRCFLRYFLDLRSDKMRTKFANEEPVNNIGPIKNLVGDFLQIYDIYTDLYLAFIVYNFSRDHYVENDSDSTNYYSICFIWICMTVFGPYLIQYSSYINQLYHEGVYQTQNFQSQNICTKLFLGLQMTAVGMLFLPIIDIIFKIQTLLSVITLPCKLRKNKKGKQQAADINLKFQIWIEKSLNMNEFEIENFKQQSKFTQMIFEDFLMLVMDALIILGYFKVPKITELGLNGITLLQQLGSSLISIFMAFSTLAYQSKTLHENKFEYILICMKARQGWIPFGNILESKKLFNNIDFGSTQLKKDGFLGTNSMGLYVPVDFKFSELTLKLFTKVISNASSSNTQNNASEKTQQVEQAEESQNQNDGIRSSRMINQIEDAEQQQMVEMIKQYEPKFDFGLSLEALTAHQFLSFIAIQQQTDIDFLYNRFDFKNVDWLRLIKNSRSYFKNKEVPGQPVSEFNQPLLQICIDNEFSPDQTNRDFRVWVLRPLFIRLIKDYECDVNIMDYFGEYTLLTYTIQNNKGQSEELLWKLCRDQIDLNQKNKDKSTNYGVFFKRYFKRDFRGNTKEFLNDPNCPFKFVSKIDIHAPQITNDNGQLRTPLGYFISQQSFLSTDEMFFLNRSKEEEEHKPDLWHVFFGEKKEFFIGSEAEIDDLLELQQKIEKQRRNLGWYGQSNSNDDNDQNQIQTKSNKMMQSNNQYKFLKTKIHKQLLENNIKDEELKKYYLKQKDKNAGIKVVGNLMQKGLLNKLQTQKEDQLSLKMSEKSFTEKKAPKQNVNLSLLPVLLHFFIEELSFFDFISDFLIVIALANSTDTAWFAFSLFTILAPYYTVYTSLINNQIDRYRKSSSNSSCLRSLFRNIGSFIMILPTMLIMLIGVDIVYMCISVVVYPILLPFSFCSIGNLLLEKYENFQNFILSNLFGLSYMEVQGFRSQRTILQFQLESIPQIFFQIYLIQQLEERQRNGQSASLNVTSSDVWVSVLFAFLHVFFEIINLNIEARTSDTPFIQYVVTCYNSREKWMPRQVYFQSKSEMDSDNQQVIEIDEPGLFCGNRLGYRIGFKYTDPTMDSLLQLVSNMSIQKLGFRKTLMIDECFKDIDLELICSLGIVAHKKIDLRCTDDYIEHLEHEMRTNKKLIQKLKILEDAEESFHDQLPSKIIQSNNLQIANVFLKVAADSEYLTYQNGISIIKQAYKEQKFDMLALMFKQKNLCKLDEQFELVIDELQITGPGEFKLPEDKEDRHSYVSMMSQLFFNPNQLIKSKDQFAHLEALIGDMDFGRNDQAEMRFHAFWGAMGCPEDQLNIIKDFQDSLGRHRDKDAWNTKWKEFNDKMKKWIAKYPNEITIKQQQNTISISTAFLCKFAKLRQVFFKTLVDAPKGDNFPDQINLAKIGYFGFVNLDDIIELKKLFDDKLTQIDMNKLQSFENSIEILGLDKDRAQYYKKSRELLPPKIQAQSSFKYVAISKGLFYKVPDNIAAIKQLSIKKDLKRTLIKQIHCGLIKFNEINAGFGWIKNIPKYDSWSLKKEKRKILDINCDNRNPKLNRGQDSYTFNLTAECIMNDVKSGVEFKNFYKVKSDSFNSEVVECKYEIEFYRKIINGQFQ